jgi:hypothetical protein
MTLVLGRGTSLRTVPDAEWRDAVAGAPARMVPRLAFMTPEHRAVREAAVTELPRGNGDPVSVARLAALTTLAIERVDVLLDELQRNLFFLVRNDDGEVAWAFPVTSDRTRHALSFSSGERLWGA